MARHFSDETTRRLAARSELKRLTVRDDAEGRLVELVPLAGTITAVYFPPMPPYTVPLKDEEADDHISLVLHLLESLTHWPGSSFWPPLYTEFSRGGTAKCVGLRAESPDRTRSAGADLVELMQAQRHRGGDSTGFGIYGHRRERGYVVRMVAADRRTLLAPHSTRSWQASRRGRSRPAGGSDLGSTSTNRTCR